VNTLQENVRRDRRGILASTTTGSEDTRARKGLTPPHTRVHHLAAIAENLNILPTRADYSHPPAPLPTHNTRTHQRDTAEYLKYKGI